MPQLLEQIADAGQVEQGNSAATNVMLTMDDLAALLRCSPRTIRRLIERGRVPKPCRFGTFLRWPRAQVEEWVARGCPDFHGGIQRN